MDTINTSDILTCNYGYDYKLTVREEDYEGIHYRCSMGMLHIRMFYKPFIMKCFSMITIDSETTGRKNYIYTKYVGQIPLQKENYMQQTGNVITYYHFTNCDKIVLTYFFKEILVQNDTNELLSFLQEGQEQLTYMDTLGWQKIEGEPDTGEPSDVCAAKVTYRNDPIILPQNIEDFSLPEQYRDCTFNPDLSGYDGNYDPLTMPFTELRYTSKPSQKLINAVHEDYETGLVILGEIPIWVYTDLLPLNEKGYITQNGKRYQILDINNSWYENVDNYIDLTKLDNIDFSRFENFYVKRVLISEEYRNKSLPFKYYENGELKNSIIEYKKIMALNIEDDTIIMNITSTGNKPLDNLIENNELDIVIRKNISSVTKMKINIQTMLITQNDITQNDDLVVELYSNLNKIILRGNDDVIIELTPENLSYTIENLFCINGTLDSNNKYTPINIYSNGQLNVPYYKLEANNYNKLININLYNVNQNNEVIESELNLIINGDITGLYDLLPLTSIKLNNEKDINYINGPVSYIEIDENTSFMNLRELSNKEEVPITKFGIINSETDEFEQNVFTNLNVYYSEYNKQLKLLNGIIRLIPEPVKEYTRDSVNSSQDFILYDQRYVNFFLFENGNSYLYLNREMSTTFIENFGTMTMTSRIIIQNWSCEINELNNITPGNLMLRYYAYGTENIREFNLGRAEKYCTNLYIVNGTIENDNLVLTENNEIAEMSSNFLGFRCRKIYSTNCIIERSINTNFVINGIIPSDIYRTILSSNDKTVNALPCNVENIEIGIKENNSIINLTNIANSSTLLNIYNNGNKKLYVNEVNILERFKDKITLPDNMFTYYDGIQEKPSTINYIKDFALELPEIKEYELTDDKKLLITFKDQATYNCFNYLVQEENSQKYLIFDMSMVYTTEEEIEYLYYLFENGLYISKDIEDNKVEFYIEPASCSNSKLRVCDTYGFIKEYIFQDTGFDVKNLKIIYNTNDNENIITPLGNVFNNENYINILNADLRVSFSFHYLDYYNEHTYNTTNCKYSNSIINIVVKGKIPSWLYKYLKLPIKIDQDNKIIREEYSYSQLVSVNAIPISGMRIDNTEPENQCSMDLTFIDLSKEQYID